MVSPYFALVGTALIGCFSQSVRDAFTSCLTTSLNSVGEFCCPSLTNYLFSNRTKTGEKIKAKLVLKLLIEYAEAAKKHSMSIEEYAGQAVSNAQTEVSRLTDQEAALSNENNSRLVEKIREKLAKAKKELENAQHARELAQSIIKLTCETGNDLVRELTELADEFKNSKDIDPSKVTLLKQPSSTILDVDVIKGLTEELIGFGHDKKHKQEIFRQTQKNFAALKIQLKVIEKHYGIKSEKYKNALEQKNEAEAELKKFELDFKETSDNATRTLATLIEFLKEMTENCEENSPSKSRSFKHLSSPTFTLITERDDEESKEDEVAKENEETKESEEATKENKSDMDQSLNVEINEPVSHLHIDTHIPLRHNESTLTAAAVLDDIGDYALDEYGLGFGGLLLHHNEANGNCS